MTSTDVNQRILKEYKPAVARNLFRTETFSEPSTKVVYDRHIPRRVHNNWGIEFATIPDSARTSPAGKKARETTESPRDTSAYNCLLRNELLGENIEDIKTQCDERQACTPLKSKNLFKYSSPRVRNIKFYSYYRYSEFKKLYFVISAKSTYFTHVSNTNSLENIHMSIKRSILFPRKKNTQYFQQVVIFSR